MMRGLEMMENRPTKAVVEETIKKWAPMMKIADWRIDFEFANRLEMEAIGKKEGYCGFCRRQRLIKQALINLDPDHYDVIDDWEYCLAHEMFHIVTDDFQYHAACCLDFVPESAHEMMENQLDLYYERLVDDLAKTFVAALRQPANLGTEGD